ncbi:MAG: 16S rRNA (cytosine(1402)-N(4))-methyltransferase RsmH [Proteobacteria bacterium]|nr:16S rRNA (cytosine(1402)-N(4))-methyltransferase RsmH [Pseudomonadota bacterium]MDA1057618.1 16S rRNA (cytosine(1402)-N(4))-methyltransferase RsmH [Pseudomonadota bacterium]
MEAHRTAPLHVPVMVSEVCAAIAPADGETYVDGTFGAGGYARAFLDAAECRVFGIDRDPAAIQQGRALESHYGGRLTLLDGRFSEMGALLAAHGVETVEGVALDLGVSSMQIDDPARGFSFMHDGPLDMRMGGDGPTAADVVNQEQETALADIIYQFGEERHSRRIAHAIVERRAEAPITTTGRLAEIVARAMPGERGRIHPATQTFQALRIYVNEELGSGGELEVGLSAAERALAPGGRLAVVSFHSLEDRTVKEFLRGHGGRSNAGTNRHLPETAAPAPATFALSPLRKPTDDEIAYNPRARSARLRSAVRTTAPCAELVR